MGGRGGGRENVFRPENSLRKFFSSATQACFYSSFCKAYNSFYPGPGYIFLFRAKFGPGIYFILPTLCHTP